MIKRFYVISRIPEYDSDIKEYFATNTAWVNEKYTAAMIDTEEDARIIFALVKKLYTCKVERLELGG